MRRKDKLKNIAKINKRLNESAFSWNGEYANETDESYVGLPGDLELKEEDLKEEEDCGCSVNEDEPTDVDSSQWFSEVDGERLMDKDFNQ